MANLENSALSNQMNSLLLGLNIQRKTGILCDVILKFAEKSIYAHANILSAMSPYFATVLGVTDGKPRSFSSQTPQNLEINIDVSDNCEKDIYVESMLAILDYMYTGEMRVTKRDVSHIGQLGSLLSMDNVIKICDKFLTVESVDNNTIYLSKPRKTVLGNTNVDSCEDFSRVPEVPLCSGDSDSITGEYNNGFGMSDYNNEVSIDHANDKSGYMIKRQLSCDQCYQTFTHTEDLEDHVVKCDHFKESSYTCVICHRLFKQESKLRSHMEIHSQVLDKVPKMTCIDTAGNLEHSVDSSNRVKTNSKRANVDRNELCNVCGKHYTTRHNLNRHMLSHTVGKIFNCTLCEMSFVFKYKLNDHLRKLHNIFIPKTTNVRLLCNVRMKGDNLYECVECGKTFTLRFNLYRHMRRHNGKNARECSECDFRSSRTDTLKIHLWSKHRIGNPTSRSQKKRGLDTPSIKRLYNSRGEYECDVCGHVFSFRNNLRRHWRRHSLNLRHKCERCEYSFARRDTLRLHMLKTHGVDSPVSDTSSVDNVKCTVWDEKLLNVKTTQHMNYCPTNKFSCTECDYKTVRHDNGSFCNIDGLRYRICEGKSFVSARTLSRHMKQHAAGKTHACSVCDFTAVGSDMLNIHMKTKHTAVTGESSGEWEYERPAAGDISDTTIGGDTRQHSPVSVTSSSNVKDGINQSCLRKKIFASEEGSELSCEECDKSFSLVGSLRRHRRLHESVPAFTCGLCTYSSYRSDRLKEHVAIKHAESGYREVIHPGEEERNRISHVVTNQRLQDGPASVRGRRNASERERCDVKFNADACEKDRISYECAVCRKSFTFETNYRRHYKKVHGDGLTSVEPHGKRSLINNLVGLLRPDDDVKPTDSSMVTRDDKWNCSECSKQFTIKSNYLRHKRNFHGNSDRFDESKSSLKVGLSSQGRDCEVKLTPSREVTKTKAWECPVCSKEFTIKSNYSRHYRRFHSHK